MMQIRCTQQYSRSHAGGDRWALTELARIPYSGAHSVDGNLSAIALSSIRGRELTHRPIGVMRALPSRSGAGLDRVPD
jgi:hypothetical protein